MSKTIYVVFANYHEESWMVGARANKGWAEKLRDDVLENPSKYTHPTNKHTPHPIYSYVQETTLLTEMLM